MRGWCWRGRRRDQGIGPWDYAVTRLAIAAVRRSGWPVRPPSMGMLGHYAVTKKAVEVVFGFPHGCDQDAAVCGPRGMVELSFRPRVVHDCRRCVVLVHRERQA